MKYDADTGIFTWIAPRPKAIVGGIAGTLTPYGYVKIGIDGHGYLAHRLAWLYTYGAWPLQQLDHKNRKRDDNRLSNLRAANNSQNSANKPASSKFGVKGVKFHLITKRWSAWIQKDRKQIYLGSFGSMEEAKIAYDRAAPKFFGEFAKINDEAPAAS